MPTDTDKLKARIAALELQNKTLLDYAESMRQTAIESQDWNWLSAQEENEKAGVLCPSFQSN